MPGGGHGGHIVEHMAFRLLHRSEIRHHFLRLHDHLPQQQNTRTDDLSNHAHHAHDGMYLREIPTAGAQLFPDIGHGVNADNVDSPVSQVQKIVHHFIEYPGIFVIQIPLVRVKCSHHIMAAVGPPCKVPGSRGGEYLGHSPLILRGNLMIVKEKIPAHIFPVPLAGPPCPLMVLRGMVHDKIHAYVDSFFMAGCRKLLQILHGTQVLLHFPKVRHGVSPVGSAFRGLQKRHQMDIIHITLFNIVQFRGDSFHISREIVYIEHHAQHIIALIPVRTALPVCVYGF